MPVTFVYFCYGWTLWLFLSWIPLFFINSYKLDIKQSAIFSFGVFFAGVVGDTLGGVMSDWLYHRTGNVRLARLSVILLGFVGAFASLVPMLYVHDLNVIALCLSAGFFFTELIIGPIWSIPMDIAPKYSGTGNGIMNTGSAVAAIISPVVAGLLIDKTGSWESPFIVTMGLVGLGTGLSCTMRPDKPFEEAASISRRGRRRRSDYAAAVRWHRIQERLRQVLVLELARAKFCGSSDFFLSAVLPTSDDMVRFAKNSPARCLEQCDGNKLPNVFDR
jgi:MFS family permease